MGLKEERAKLESRSGSFRHLRDEAADPQTAREFHRQMLTMMELEVMAAEKMKSPAAVNVVMGKLRQLQTETLHPSFPQPGYAAEVAERIADVAEKSGRTTVAISELIGAHTYWVKAGNPDAADLTMKRIEALRERSTAVGIERRPPA